LYCSVGIKFWSVWDFTTLETVWSLKWIVYLIRYWNLEFCSYLNIWSVIVIWTVLWQFLFTSYLNQRNTSWKQYIPIPNKSHYLWLYELIYKFYDETIHIYLNFVWNFINLRDKHRLTIIPSAILGLISTLLPNWHN
jgi:hypothetical protein